MPSTYTSLYYHFVFATKSRDPLIKSAWQARLHSYMSGIFSNREGQVLAVNGLPDHVHFLVRLSPNKPVAYVARDVKSEATKWLHSELGEDRFSWQDGYGGFTVSFRDLPMLRNYIASQEVHHRKVSLREEYLTICKENGVDPDMRFFD